MQHQTKEIYLGYRDEYGEPSVPLPKQMLGHASVGPFKDTCIAGSLGTGKTEWQCQEMITQAASFPKNMILTGRKVLDAFKKSTLIQLLEAGGDFIKVHRPQDHEIIMLNDSKIVYLALDDTRDAIQRIKSMNLGAFSFDQLEEVPEETYRAARGQLRRKNSALVNFHTCNPAGHDWVWRRFKKNLKDNHKLGRQLIETVTWPKGMDPPTSDLEVQAHSDNPYLPYEYIVGLLENPTHWVNRYVHCEWDDFAGLVYPMFDYEKHFIKPFNIPDWWDRYIIYDYGYTNPTAIMFAAVDPNGVIYVYDLIYVSEMIIPEIYPMVHQRTKGRNHLYKWYADPSIVKTERDGSNVADEWEDYSIFWDMAKNDKRAGFERVGKYLHLDSTKKGPHGVMGRAKLYFFDIPAMQPVYDEVSEYKWAELKYNHSTKNKPEEPVKRKDHTCDDLRYLVHAVEDASSKPKKPMDEYDMSRFYEKSGKRRNKFMSV